ncbi:O(6)-methylguanine-induced apoptosis 2 isoform X2 [Seriola lalandi dorsalis]|uniref:O(6)-methylguanine-induced apoptosis 2 isoform X2 n=1 Tax=Seriola lalandi dorsalis TaxID=1841481 RepID=UPI000C6F70FB|nr:O(6)-methylguanine-induced apoptosis 2 isoform X2 [Seriola lalandi dorsalis]
MAVFPVLKLQVLPSQRKAPQALLHPRSGGVLLIGTDFRGILSRDKVARGYRNPQRAVPGPNVYNIQSSFINKYDFNIGVSRVFRLPVAVQLDAPKHKTPAPNQYDVSCGSRERISSVVGTSAFLSKIGRDSFYTNNNVPSPCNYLTVFTNNLILHLFYFFTLSSFLILHHTFVIGQYEVNNHLIQHSSKAVLSPFKSKTQRIPALVDNHMPGPGAYSPHQVPALVKKAILPRGCYLAISAPPLIAPKDPPMPGPGQYDIGNYDGASKHPMLTAAFASRTKRLPEHSGADMKPGPGFYNPQILSKQSFFYNDSRVWIPA